MRQLPHAIGATWPRSCGVLLVLLQLLPHACAAPAPAPSSGAITTTVNTTIGTGSPRLTRTNGLYEICISDWSPMVTCDGLTTDQFSGYMVSLMANVIDRMAWTQSQYYYRCMDWTPMVDDLSDSNGTCFMSAAGMDVTPTALSANVRFSWPTYKQGLQVLVATSASGSSIWTVFNAFNWTVWLALGLTAIGIGWVLWVTEQYGARLPIFSSYVADEADDQASATLSGPSVSAPSAFALLASGPSTTSSTTPLKGGVSKTSAQAGQFNNQRRKRLHRYIQEVTKREQRKEQQQQTVSTMTYYTIAKLVGMGEPDPLTWGGRVVIFAYGLLVLIMINLYTAETASVITTTQVRHNVQGLSDLVGRRVGTWFPYVDALAKKGITAVGLAWEDKDDETAMLNMLLHGTIDALVLDSSFVKYTAAQNCSFTAVGRAFNTWSLAFAFPGETPASDVNALSLNLVALQQNSHVLDDLENQFITLAACTSSVVDVKPVTFAQVRGLWIILGGAIGACFVLLLSSMLVVHYMKQRSSPAHQPNACTPACDAACDVPLSRRESGTDGFLVAGAEGQAGSGFGTAQTGQWRSEHLQDGGRSPIKDSLGRTSSVETGSDVHSTNPMHVARFASNSAPLASALTSPLRRGGSATSRTGSAEMLRGRTGSVELPAIHARSIAILEEQRRGPHDPGSTFNAAHEPPLVSFLGALKPPSGKLKGAIKPPSTAFKVVSNPSFTASTESANPAFAAGLKGASASFTTFKEATSPAAIQVKTKQPGGTPRLTH